MRRSKLNRVRAPQQVKRHPEELFRGYLESSPLPAVRWVVDAEWEYMTGENYVELEDGFTDPPVPLALVDAYVRADRVRRFRARSGFLPHGLDDPEGAAWLDQMRRAASGMPNRSGIVWSRELQWLMDTVIPGWLDTGPSFVRDDVRFRARATEVAAYRKRHGELPMADDLGMWLRATRLSAHEKGRAKWSPERQRIMDDLVPGWQESTAAPRISSDTIRTRAEQIASYREALGRFPPSNAHDPQIKSLGTWLVTVRRSARGAGSLRWCDEWQQIMDEVVPGWQSASRKS
ncbi:hypothetical protein [Isoptericola sp. NPDC056605]|uniref:hypothetical protein n=1 Tax=Isoptericola sp. NPDC056605 TaxID=3345876 RepID=UPI0036B77F64